MIFTAIYSLLPFEKGLIAKEKSLWKYHFFWSWTLQKGFTILYFVLNGCSETQVLSPLPWVRKSHTFPWIVRFVRLLYLASRKF